MTSFARVWHLTSDAPRLPRRVSAGESVELHIGTWPIADGQRVWVSFQSADAPAGRVEANWQQNANGNSHWLARLGPFAEAECIRYAIHLEQGSSEVRCSEHEFRVGPKIFLSLLWHHHQPDYRQLVPPSRDGETRRQRCVRPWVRLHALRDYYSMAALLAERSTVHATFNLTPILIEQLEQYVAGTATDRALELTLKCAEDLSAAERNEVLATFFDADWHHQIFPHARYRELFERRATGQPFSASELRDLQMWFNLAWFGSEFRTGEVRLVGGDYCSVSRFVDRSRGFSQADLVDMVAEQRRLLSAILPLHQLLLERGQIEVSTTPYYHPILPLLIDTDAATLDRPGTTLPERFAWPEDAAAQLTLACDAYETWFGRGPRGMWPAEGAVSQSSVALFAHANVRWIATDQQVLARSGRWGYQSDRPDVACRARRACQGDAQLAVFFRDTELSDAIGFRYANHADPEAAVDDFVRQVRSRFIERFETEGDRLLTVILDGENAWGSFQDDGRPFLRALYRRLSELHSEIRTVNFEEWLSGNDRRGVPAHPVEQLDSVHDLFTGSWIDETGSAPGVDLGTWVGEPEENRAWQLLGKTRCWLAERAYSADAPAAFASLYAAEGSDWFWWYGSDQDSGQDELFDQLFRGHLASVYAALGVAPPAELDEPIVPPAIVWTFVAPVRRLPSGVKFVFQTNCPGLLRWTVDDGTWQEQPLVLAGGVMEGAHHYELRLGPFPPSVHRLAFEFQCRHARCPGGPCCGLGVHEVELEAESVPPR
ncbi:MAG TPA: glycoside hydrolase family 57 protein [Polyangiaceae bacterium]|nr:glycoside hydrolase family 57 protein [Polyangiaceae bacterium]